MIQNKNYLEILKKYHTEDQFTTSQSVQRSQFFHQRTVPWLGTREVVGFCLGVMWNTKYSSPNSKIPVNMGRFSQNKAHMRTEINMRQALLKGKGLQNHHII